MAGSQLLFYHLSFGIINVINLRQDVHAVNSAPNRVSLTEAKPPGRTAAVKGEIDETKPVWGAVEDGLADLHFESPPLVVTAADEYAMPTGFLRSSSSDIQVEGNYIKPAGATVTGTTYGPTANLAISGSGNWNSQFIVNSMSITGHGTVTTNYSGQNQGLAPEVFLVEWGVDPRRLSPHRTPGVSWNRIC